LFSGCKKSDPKSDQKLTDKCFVFDQKGEHTEAQRCYAGVVKANPAYSDEHLRKIEELTPKELEAANAICRKALKDYFGEGNIYQWARNECDQAIVTADHDVPELAGIKLARSIDIFSVLVPELRILSYSQPKFTESGIRRGLSELVTKLEISGEGKHYRVVKGLVLIDPEMIKPASPGTVGGLSYDGITLVPYRVAVF